MPPPTLPHTNERIHTHVLRHKYAGDGFCENLKEQNTGDRLQIFLLSFLRKSWNRCFTCLISYFYRTIFLTSEQKLGTYRSAIHASEKSAPVWQIQ